MPHDLDKKLPDLMDLCPYVDTWTDIARYCNVAPSTVTLWRKQGYAPTKPINRYKQLDELFQLKPGTLQLPWSRFLEETKGLNYSSSPWKRLLIEADPNSLLEICRRDPARPDARLSAGRMVPEDEPDDEPIEVYLRGEPVYLRLELPKAYGWARYAVVLSKGADVIRCLCPSALCPDMGLEPVTHFPRDITGTVFKTAGEGVQTLITVLTAASLPPRLAIALAKSATRVPEGSLNELAVTVKPKDAGRSAVYRRDYRVLRLSPGLAQPFPAAGS